MEPIAGVLSVLTGLLLRLALPVAVTGGAVWLLRGLDARWQMEAERTRAQLLVVPVEPCWETKHCPPERVVSCPAYLDQSAPCWQHFRDRSGNLQQRCLACQLFQQAAVPSSTRPQVLH
jgi:hypothetical protein